MPTSFPSFITYKIPTLLPAASGSGTSSDSSILVVMLSSLPLSLIHILLVRVDYSEKLDLLTLSIRYQGDHHDPKDSDNELFLEMLEEPTTELIDQIIEPAYGIYNNLIQINFKWEEAQ